MIYYLKYDIQSICKRLIQEQLKGTGFNYTLLNCNELDINQSLTKKAALTLSAAFQRFEMLRSYKMIILIYCSNSFSENSSVVFPPALYSPQLIVMPKSPGGTLNFLL